MRAMSVKNHWYVSFDGGVSWTWIGPELNVCQFLDISKNTCIDDVAFAAFARYAA